MGTKQKFNWLKWLIVLAILGGGAAGAIYYFKRPKVEPLVYKTSPVGKGEITQSVTANGALNPIRTVTVGSQVSGTILKLNVDFNSRVKQGDALAIIDPATFERAVARAQADLASSKAGLEMAKFNAKQAKQLFTQKLISETEYQQNEVALLQADANVKIRQAAVDTAQVDLDRTTIIAPIDGIVISRKVDAGQTVAASFNTPEMFTIANDLTKMQIDTLVSEADVGGIQEGQNVNFLVDAFPGRKFKGTVKQVRFAPITNQNVVTYTTVVEVDNRDLRLRPGMTANATIITSQRTNIFHVPNSALRFRPPENAVIASTNDTIAKAAGTNVQSGARGGGGGGFSELPPPPWMAERRRPTDEERKKYEDSLTPEQREKYQEQMRVFRERMRARMAEGGGGGGGEGGGGGSRPATPQYEGPAIRQVYLLDKEKSTPGKPVLTAVSVKTGIADSSNTEVMEGLKEGDVVVTGTITATAEAAGGPPNPFGGPFGGGRRR
jgi:HlyD family secretion protein